MMIKHAPNISVEITRAKRLLGVVIPLLLVACGHTQQTQGGARGGTPMATSYDLPRSNPAGKFYLMSVGLEELDAGAGQPAVYVHIRMAAENQSDVVPWVVDSRDQELFFADGARVAPSFAKANVAGPPVLKIDAGARGELDLWYPLPANADPDNVTMDWRVNRGDVVEAEQTVFRRQTWADDEGQYTYYEPAYQSSLYVGVGSGWWWGPYWGWWGYDHPYYWSYRPRYYGGYYGGYGGYYGGYGYGYGYGGNYGGPRGRPMGGNTGGRYQSAPSRATGRERVASPAHRGSGRSGGGAFRGGGSQGAGSRGHGGRPSRR